MPRTFLAGFRGADGRSLARALALLLVVAGCIGAAHAGRMAVGVTAGFVVCSVNGAGTSANRNPTLPVNQDHCICCAFGCTGATPGVLAETVERPPAAPEAKVHSVVQSSFAVPLRRPLNAGPRGPPVLA